MLPEMKQTRRDRIWMWMWMWTVTWLCRCIGATARMGL